MTTVDARGRSCPEPVIMTRNGLKANGHPLRVLVDQQVAVDNITRFAGSQGLSIRVIRQGEEFELLIGEEQGK